MLTVVHRGKSVQVDSDGWDLAALHEGAGHAFGLSAADTTIKLILKGKTLPSTVGVPADTHVKPGAKVMMVASARAAADEPRSDPTVRGFEQEDAMAAARFCEVASDEVSEWGTGAKAFEYRCCRFEPCTWQSFGTRPSSQTPHAFEARSLMLKLAQDPAIAQIMRQRQY